MYILSLTHALAHAAQTMHNMYSVRYYVRMIYNKLCII